MKRPPSDRGWLRWPSARGVVERVSTRIFTVREIVLVGLVFVLGVPALHLLMDVANRVLFDGSAVVSATWPINVFYVHVVWEPVWLLGLTLLVAIGLFVVLVPGVIVLDDDRVLLAAVAGTVLIFATTLIQGYGPGLVTPTAGGHVVDLSNQYYHDAIQISDPLGFLSGYSTQQPDLRSHSRTHPPGAVLTFYLLERLVESPARITISIALLAVGISVPALYGILVRYVERQTAQYTCLLYLLLPSVQIYYAAALDALVAALVVAAVYCFVCRPFPTGALGATIFLFLASFQTFMFLFALPVLVGYEVLRERSVHRTLVVISGLVVAYGALSVAFEFHYVRSFLVASAIQNPDGPLLLANPGKYVTSRLMGVTEIVVFFTPFLTWLLYRERHVVRAHRDLFALTGLAILTFVAQLAVGTFRDGETARAAMYLYPFLVLPLATYFDAISITRREQLVLAALVFGQTLAMQLMGFYFW